MNYHDQPAFFTQLIQLTFIKTICFLQKMKPASDTCIVKWKNNDKSYMTNEVLEKFRVLFTTVPCSEVDSIYCSPRNRYCSSCSKVLILPITEDNIVYFWVVIFFLKLVSWLVNKKKFFMHMFFRLVNLKTKCVLYNSLNIESWFLYKILSPYDWWNLGYIHICIFKNFFHNCIVTDWSLTIV